MLTIAATDLHWLAGGPPAADLCAHGGLVVQLDGVTLVDAADEELAVSTAALHLLRTLRAEHTPERPIAEQLAPHCGHWMWVDEATGQVVNGGCRMGVDWWVRHTPAGIRLELPGQPPVHVAAAAWCGAVTAFADQVEAFYRGAAPKALGADDDAVWYAAFWREWHARRSAAACAGGA